MMEKVHCLWKDATQLPRFLPDIFCYCLILNWLGELHDAIPFPQPQPRAPWKGVAHEDVTRLIPWAEKCNGNWPNRSVHPIF